MLTVELESYFNLFVLKQFKTIFGAFLQRIRWTFFWNAYEVWPLFFELLIYSFFFFDCFNLAQLTDLFGHDHISFEKRITITYSFFNLLTGFCLLTHLQTSVFLFVQTIQHLYRSSSWLERECWDMYGVFFFGQRNLWRLISDYGFLGFPLRKDFPLTGYYEKFYVATLHKIIRKRVELMQELKTHSLSFGWWVSNRQM